MQDDMTQDEVDAILRDGNENAGAEQDAAAGVRPDGLAGDEFAAETGTGGIPELPSSDNVGSVHVPGLDDDTNIEAPPGGTANINFLLDVPLDVAVELGRTKIAVKDMLQLGPGSVIELDKLIGEPVDLLVNERLIAKGEVVVFDENFGVRITDIINTEDRLKSLG